jgi:hypothetical protein
MRERQSKRGRTECGDARTTPRGVRGRGRRLDLRRGSAEVRRSDAEGWSGCCAGSQGGREWRMVVRVDRGELRAGGGADIRDERRRWDLHGCGAGAGRRLAYAEAVRSRIGTVSGLAGAAGVRAGLRRTHGHADHGDGQEDGQASSGWAYCENAAHREIVAVSKRRVVVRGWAAAVSVSV